MNLRRLSFSLTSGAAALLLAGLLLAGAFWHAALLLAGFALWAFAFWRKLAPAARAGFALIGAFSLAAFFTETGQPANFYLILVSILLSLAAYDLADLDARLSVIGEPATEQTERIRQHFIRLGLVLSAGLVLAVVGFNWKIALEFGPVVALGLLTALGLGFLARTLISMQD
jgi:hypothetical protein